MDMSKEIRGGNASRRRLALATVMIVLVGLLAVFASMDADAATYRYGSRGDVVKRIQRVLRDEGFYDYYVDGIYGSRTVDAVKAFQRSCGLTVDGICGPVTLKYLGLEQYGGSSGSGSGDMALLARIIAAEARGESYSGQVAVGAVILNRIKHPSFPNTLAGVIYQPGAFTAIDDGQFATTTVPDSCRRAAADAMNGWDPTGGCIYYFNPNTATSAWIWSRPQVVTIGRHIFCR